MCPWSLSLQMCPAVLWSLFCSSFMEHKQQTVFIHSPFISKLQHVTESYYVSYSKIVGVDFQVLSTLCSITVFYAFSKNWKGFIYE